jgi:glutathione S-transferase
LIIAVNEISGKNAMQGTYRVLGALGSPYSLKMRAIMRYRRIPHVWIQTNSKHEEERAKVKPAVIPVIQYPDGSYHNDSTPMIYDLERLHPERSIIPEDAGDAFLAKLLEDMADEWGTKLMFHYRWFRARDQEQMSHWLAFDRFSGGGRSKIKAFATNFRDRQVGRMALVGCTEENQPLIEETGRLILGALESHVVDDWFFFGSRPSLAEFSWFGQFSQLIVDPTPNDLLRATAPFTVRWLMHVDDLSGIDGEWEARRNAPVVERLLELAGRIYFPFLLANEEAAKRGAETFRFEALGMPYEQGTFKYQMKCLWALREAYAALAPADRARIDPVLEKTGCKAALTA